ncbi:methylated-DNA--[protein]-cysteine S-methyltransferase [Arcobacter cryaerophilus gv. pseudocryaerophilus]
MKDYTIYTTTIQTQKLIMFAAIFQEELILFVPFEKEFCNKKLESFKKTLKASNIVEDDSKFQKLKIELDEYFKNQRDNFTIPIRLIGTPFQIKCWEALQKIEYGETISYKEEAKNIGNEKAYRAVANANGKNNLSIIVPCHRVIANNGKHWWLHWWNLDKRVSTKFRKRRRMNLISLQMKTCDNFETNLENLKNLILSCKNESLILAPELALVGFAYDKMEEASIFSIKAIDEIKELSENKIIAITTIIKEDDKFYNRLFIFFNKNIVHTQDKIKLFPLGDEDKYFTPSKDSNIKIIDINGLKIATLICFELRFPTLWEQIKGADIILNPAMWGIKRKEHYETISKALALVNQSFVIASNSANDNMAKGSAIISPFGNIIKDDNKTILEAKFDKDEILKVRKYIDIGLN